MNELSTAAAILGKKGGQAGTGKSKARPHEQARLAALRRWALEKYGNNEQRFWKFVHKFPVTGTCWNWTGERNKRDGYGRFYPTGMKRILAHRFSWQLANGVIPEGMCVLHTCDNPPCVNPEHLYLGTQKENTRDSIERNRYCFMQGTKNGMAKLTEAQIKEIRRLRSEGSGIRELSRMYGVDKRAIQLLVRRLTWKHVI